MSSQVRRATMLNALLLLLLALGSGGADCTGPVEASRFDYPDDVVDRDNTLVGGVYWDGDGEADTMAETGGVFHTNTGDFRSIELDLLGPVGEGDAYSFTTDSAALPFALDPGVDNVFELRRAETDASPIVSTTVTLDPEVLVFPVYTWNFISEDTGLGVPDIDERVARYLFDRASGTQLPADLEDNYWAHERPDQLWSQCGIQFRHMGHFEVTVPDCWTNSVIVAHEDRCSVAVDICRTDYGNVVQDFNDCDEQEVNECTLHQYLKFSGHKIDDAINLYFVNSFHPFITPSTVGVGCRYQQVAYFNSAVRTGPAATNLGYTVAHELGHVLGNLGHIDQTVMASGTTGKADTLTEDQCEEARTHNVDMLANTL
jgi:hypothetical protein